MNLKRIVKLLILISNILIESAKKGAFMVTGSLQIKNGRYHAVMNLEDENGKRYQKWISTGLPVRGNKKAADRFLQNELAKVESLSSPE